MKQRFYSNGKLLITGEYVVLDGANALAVPTKYGQTLEIEPFNQGTLLWQSFNSENELWFTDEIHINEGFIIHESTNNAISTRLIEILNAAKQLNPDFLNKKEGFKVSTKLNFPNNWGLGTSSTLINNIAQWANIDAFKLLKFTFGGSGYDIACAQHNTPITYCLQNKTPIVEAVSFLPEFKKHLYFVHLNQKQNSRDGIKHYKNNRNNVTEIIAKINVITLKIISCKTLNDFFKLINEHETLIAEITNQTPVKERLFSDFNGSIKSLGAWGGDFVLVASENNPSKYFKNKGFKTVINYNDMIL
ncbi:GYDIA family GHMP kinase [Neotamlana laminarinivorans]|uniref:GHMP kinase n=1 Tax=Neotamlana laminarinivorans TaxID=2883124 RepID=A0A9X1HZ13_9FLAO|nr:GYDIA family GHMP kinase [Tamlana laminarinivorans]MCB4797257.1 GHMP kinase [Tamlana laminarinivorans]